jgi:tetratricopeptide (TPR) repeat protein
MHAGERIEAARALLDRAVFDGEDDALDRAERELDAVEADLALRRGQIARTRGRPRHPDGPDELTSLEHAVRLYQGLGDERGEAEALLWVAIHHQMARRDDDTAVPLLRRALDLATRAGDRMTTSYVLRHLGIADHAAGRLDEARDRLAESTRLRRELGFLPGVAANLVGLAHVAMARGENDRAAELIDEAADLAGRGGAGAVLRSVEQARTRL